MAQTGQRAEGRGHRLLLSALCSLLFAGITLSAQRGGGPPARARPSGDRQSCRDRGRGEALQRNVHVVPWEGRDGRRARPARCRAESPLSSPHGSGNFRHDQERNHGHADAAVRRPVHRRQSGRSPPTSVGFAALLSIRLQRATWRPARPSSGARRNCGSCHMVKGQGQHSRTGSIEPAGTRKVQNIVDALTKAKHKIAADGGTHDMTIAADDDISARARHHG